MLVLPAMVLAFLFGSFPSGVVIGRFLGRDPRLVGSGNIGAANVTRAAGFKAGAVVAILDIVKGVVPLALGAFLGLGTSALALLALAAVLGHDFSIFLGFRGGKGVATSLGVAAVLSPVAAVLTGLIWVSMVFTSGYSSVGSLCALFLLPVLMAFTGSPSAYVWAAFALFLLAVAQHRGNIQRLLAGTEPSRWHGRVNGS
jgi:acyl phosphate:glycerol-3-phosphate acyltransferase